MPTTVAEAFAAAGLTPAGVVRWREPVPETAQGVYVVALSDDSDSSVGALAVPPLGRGALEELERVCPELRVDGAPAGANDIAQRVSGFWLAQEVILYVGLARQPLRTRVRQYYATRSERSARTRADGG